MAAAPRAAGPGRWLAGHFNVALAVYDVRRGQAEGAEADKVLGFYPPAAPAAMQSSIVGLAQAVTVFAGTFNKVCARGVRLAVCASVRSSKRQLQLARAQQHQQKQPKYFRRTPTRLFANNQTGVPRAQHGV